MSWGRPRISHQKNNFDFWSRSFPLFLKCPSAMDAAHPAVTQFLSIYKKNYSGFWSCNLLRSFAIPKSKFYESTLSKKSAGESCSRINEIHQWNRKFTIYLQENSLYVASTDQMHRKILSKYVKVKYDATDPEKYAIVTFTKYTKNECKMNKSIT
jgi:hypothetical protein